MGSKKFIILSLFLILSMMPGNTSGAGLGDLFKGIQKTITGETQSSDNKIINGLKEALEIGAANAIKTVSKTNGYYNNHRIKIPLPASIQKVEKLLRTVGFGSKVDEFEKSMNHAAEQAAPQAKNIFIDAIKSMSFGDAKKILKGRENEATLYFEGKTRDQLYKLFEPVVHSTMSKVGVTSLYQSLESKAGSLPFTNMQDLNLDSYVTNSAMDGLFLMLADEERKIRQDPAARVTDLLKEVFSQN